MRKFETPIEVALPSAWICSKAFQVSTKRLRDGTGQWMRYRSTASSPSFSRLRSIASKADCVPWSEFQSLVVMNSSSRGMPDFSIARPTPPSLP